MQSSLIRRCLKTKSFSFSRYFSTLQALEKGQTIGFIGLGNMGANMATNLIKNGHNLVVFDVFQPSIDKIKELGSEHGVSVTQKSSPKQVATEVDVLVTMLPSSPHVTEVYTGKDGIIESFSDRKALGRSKLLALDCSTISPPVAKEVANAVNCDDAVMADAPVSGGVTGAAAGTLTFMVGGDAGTFEASKPVLQMMGKNIVHCGESGTGQAAKVCNNLILAISMAGVAEAYNIGLQLGMKPEILANIVNTSSGRCWSSDAYNPVPGVMNGVPSSNNYLGGFGVDLMLKDINLAREAAGSVGAPTMMGDVAADIYDSISKTGSGKKDFGFIYQHYKESTKH